MFTFYMLNINLILSAGKFHFTTNGSLPSYLLIDRIMLNKSNNYLLWDHSFSNGYNMHVILTLTGIFFLMIHLSLSNVWQKCSFTKFWNLTEQMVHVISLKFSCNAFYLHKWYYFITKLDIVLISSNYNHMDRIGVCHIIGQKSLRFQIISVLFFKRQG